MEAKVRHQHRRSFFSTGNDRMLQLVKRLLLALLFVRDQLKRFTAIASWDSAGLEAAPSLPRQIKL